MTTLSDLKRRCKASLLPVIFLVVLFSCKKESLDTIHNGQTVTRPATDRGLVIVRNNSASPIRVTVNGVTREKYILASLQDTLSGKPGTTAKILVETVVADSLGNPAGQQLILQYTVDFPADNMLVLQEVNIPANLFFLKLCNLSGQPANRLVVSEPGSNATISSDVPLVNNQTEIACGYFPVKRLLANVRVFSAAQPSREWDFSNIALPGTVNQCITVTCW